ncbi:MAG TPA: Rieske (2Fe-2S) protein [Gaiellales bacterium]|nr:Rieske (2Fe-2S) protein [Gaiellales bacterium]
MKLVRRMFALIVAVVLRSRAPEPMQPEPSPDGDSRIVPEGEPSPRAELVVAVLLVLAAMCAIAFVVVYALDAIPDQTQYLGLTLGGTFALLAAALLVAGHFLVVTEHLEGEYADPDEQEADKVAQVIREGGGRMRRRKLLLACAGAAGAALAAAAAAPLVSLGPVFDLARFTATPWKRGVRLVGEDGMPILAADIQPLEFLTAFPEHADPEQLGAPLVVVRLDPIDLHLPADRAGWAPEGIVAYSKICTHAGCAIALFRKPLFRPVDRPPGLVCPCHYSTFDPGTGGTVVYGPAGRPLPQLPLTIDRRGYLRASGNFSGPVGPSWWGVRDRKAT